MSPFLPPIEAPQSFGLKLAYYFTKKRFGKVLMPLKVHSARLPTAFGMFYAKVGELDKKLILPGELVLLVRQQVAQLNGCAFCIDASRAAAIAAAAFSEAKFDALPQYAASSLFSPAEQAALNYATELTRNKQVAPSTFQQLANHYAEREICELVYLVASEHIYNLTNIGLNIHSDRLCDATRKKQ